jgi:hypothetical protein
MRSCRGSSVGVFHQGRWGVTRRLGTRFAAVNMWTVSLAVALSSCGASVQKSSAFDGRETPSWLSLDADITDRYPPDLLPSFEASARAFGCRTERLGARTIGLAGHGYAPMSYGVTAHCESGTIALLALKDERVRVGCEKPSTRESCEALLKKISEAH